MKKLRFMIPLIVVPISAAFSIYYKDHINTFFGTTFASNYLLGVLITVEAFNVYFAYFSDRRKELESKKNYHKESFYDMLDTYAISPRMYWDTGQVNKFFWCDHGGYPLFENLKLHLQKYELGTLYDECRDYYDTKTDEIEQKIKTFNDYIDKKLELFTALPDSDEYLGQTKPHFMKKQLKMFLLANMYRHYVNEHIPLCEIKISEPPNSSLLPSLDITNKGGIAVGDKIILDNLYCIVSLLPSDQNLMSIIRELDKMEKQIDESSYKDRFDKERKSLLLKLREGQQDLKGRCDLCPK